MPPAIDHAALSSSLRDELVAQCAGASIGAFGAIGEFVRDWDEPVECGNGEPLTLITARGAIAIELRAQAHPVAYETPSNNPHNWATAWAICLPEAIGRSACRNVVTDLGCDGAAIRPADRDARVFDLGIGAVNSEFCVRTREPGLIAQLERAAGTPLLGGNDRLVHALVEANPHRIVRSRLGRVEVYQPIGREVTPPGPHTHLLPKLLRAGRTHDANVPIPAGVVPCLTVYPRPSDTASPDAVRRMSDVFPEHWGRPEYVAEKHRVRELVLAGETPERYALPRNRLRRAALRVTLRQLQREAAPNPNLMAWRARFDPVATPAT